jgi:hypothetical protein
VLAFWVFFLLWRLINTTHTTLKRRSLFYWKLFWVLISSDRGAVKVATAGANVTGITGLDLLTNIGADAERPRPRLHQHQYLYHAFNSFMSTLFWRLILNIITSRLHIPGKGGKCLLNTNKINKESKNNSPTVKYLQSNLCFIPKWLTLIITRNKNKHINALYNVLDNFKIKIKN